MKDSKEVPWSGKCQSSITLNFDWAGQLPFAVRSCPTNLTHDVKKSHLENLKDSMYFVNTVAMQEE